MSGSFFRNDFLKSGNEVCRIFLGEVEYLRKTFFKKIFSVQSAFTLSILAPKALKRVSMFSKPRSI